VRYEIAATIPCYQTDAVGCFDPTKVAVRLRDTVPGVILCVHDHAWDRYEAFRDHNLDAALPSLANDARRLGPIYKFRIHLPGSDQLFEGICQRYTVRVTSVQPFPQPLKSQLLEFFNSLTLDGIAVTSVQQDGNSSEPC
jgi:hypothetical protein